MQLFTRILMLTVLCASVPAASHAGDIYASEANWTAALRDIGGIKSNSAFAYAPMEPGLPRVLLIGDSISIGYTLMVRDLLAGIVTVQRVPCNAESTMIALEGRGDRPRYLEAVGLEKGRWDLIHFNWGLHDLKFVDPDNPKRKITPEEGGIQVCDPEQYGKNFAELVKELDESGAALVFATTTPTFTASAGRPYPFAEEAYNKKALEVLEGTGVRVNDLWTLMRRHAVMQKPNNVHWTEEGSETMARQAASVILDALKKEGKLPASTKVPEAPKS